MPRPKETNGGAETKAGSIGAPMATTMETAAVSSGGNSVGGGGHRQSGQNLVVDGQAVWLALMGALVVGALDHSVLGKLAHALGAERVAAGERSRLLVVVVVRLEADTALKY